MFPPGSLRRDRPLRLSAALNSMAARMRIMETRVVKTAVADEPLVAKIISAARESHDRIDRAVGSPHHSLTAALREVGRRGLLDHALLRRLRRLAAAADAVRHCTPYSVDVLLADLELAVDTKNDQVASCGVPCGAGLVGAEPYPWCTPAVDGGLSDLGEAASSGVPCGAGHVGAEPYPRCARPADGGCSALAGRADVRAVPQDDVQVSYFYLDMGETCARDAAVQTLCTMNVSMSTHAMSETKSMPDLGAVSLRRGRPRCRPGGRRRRSKSPRPRHSFLGSLYDLPDGDAEVKGVAMPSRQASFMEGVGHDIATEAAVQTHVSMLTHMMREMPMHCGAMEPASREGVCSDVKAAQFDEDADVVQGGVDEALVARAAAALSGLENSAQRMFARLRYELVCWASVEELSDGTCRSHSWFSRLLQFVVTFTNAMFSHAGYRAHRRLDAALSIALEEYRLLQPVYQDDDNDYDI
mmetsp:Transcript_89070/g.256828  ORF Transcript_89070/g.256828 Transcript_89070/m.256828 type:complete len:471 (-) Transcript_89070:183-1595(-)